MRESADTRTRIQQVALELFTEQGYDGTSLREIAERLGVTKAALYYHFKTKEDIVASLVEIRLAALERLLEWGQAQPRTVEVRQELLRRYSADLLAGRHHLIMRFMERNQAALRDNKVGERMREQMLRLVELLRDHDAPLTTQLRCTLAIFAMHATWFIFREPGLTDTERQEVALAVALDLVSVDDPAAGRSGDD
jgi:AcrR family transcriptional regulator